MICFYTAPPIKYSMTNLFFIPARIDQTLIAMDKFAEIRKQFPVTENRIYLNNAAIAPVPPFISAEAVRIFDGYAAEGGDLEGEWHRRIAEIRRRVAELVGASAEEIFFTKNTSEGLILAARGFPWRAGDSVVSLQGEFPAVTVPLNLLAARGVGLRLVAPGPDNSYRLEDIEAAVDETTRMIVASFVEFHTGCRNDLIGLGELCRRHNLFFAVDGVQGVGALQTAAADWSIDLLSVGGHKWMLSGEGIGFCYLRSGRLDDLDPFICSWLSLEEPLEFLSQGLEVAAFDKPLRKDSRRFEGGTINVAGIMALGKSVETMLELGTQNIEKHILDLGSRAVQGLKSKGYKVISPQEKERRSGITCFHSAKHDNRRLLAELRRKNFSLGFPCGSIRLSPHYYNNEEDIDRLLEALPES